MAAASKRKVAAARKVAEQLKAEGRHFEADQIKSCAMALSKCADWCSHLQVENMKLREQLKGAD